MYKLCNWRSKVKRKGTYTVAGILQFANTHTLYVQSYKLQLCCRSHINLLLRNSWYIQVHGSRLKSSSSDVLDWETCKGEEQCINLVEYFTCNFQWLLQIQCLFKWSQSLDLCCKSIYFYGILYTQIHKCLTLQEQEWNIYSQSVLYNM